MLPRMASPCGGMRCLQVLTNNKDDSPGDNCPFPPGRILHCLLEGCLQLLYVRVVEQDGPQKEVVFAPQEWRGLRRVLGGHCAHLWGLRMTEVSSALPDTHAASASASERASGAFFISSLHWRAIDCQSDNSARWSPQNHVAQSRASTLVWRPIAPHTVQFVRSRVLLGNTSDQAGAIHMAHTPLDQAVAVPNWTQVTVLSRLRA